MDEELAKTIQDYVGAHNVCTIAVTDGKNPGAHTVYYVNNGLRIYFESNPQSQKVHILRAHPQISLTIDEDYADWREVKGIQLFGAARVVDESRARKLREAFLDKFPHISEFGGIPKHHVFVEVIPEKIVFLDYTKGFGYERVYFPKEKSSKIEW